MQLGNLIKVTALFAAAFLIQGCSSTSNIPKPTEGYSDINYKPQSSTISVPISIGEKALNAKINSEITGLLYQDNDMKDDNLMVKVWKAQPIQVKLNGMSVEYRIPLKVWLKGGVTKLGITVAKDVSLQIALKYRTSFAISQDWRISTKTVSAGYEWISNPSVSLAGFKVPVRTVADKIVNGMQSKVCTEIDNQIKSQFNLREMVGEMWQQIQKPMLVNPEYHVWVKVLPSEILATPFVTRNGIINSSLGVKAQTEVLISSAEPQYTVSGKLPNFKVAQRPDNHFSFNIVSDIPYAEAEKMAIAEVQGKTFSSGSKKVKVEGLKLYGSNGKAVVAATLSGSFNGTIYFVGVPVYNKETKSVEVADLDFELQTRNILMKSASWLFKSTIKDMMKKNMVIPISSYLTEAQKMANSNLKNNHAVKNISINGEVDQIDVDGIYLAATSFKVVGIAKGKLNIAIEGLNF